MKSVIQKITDVVNYFFKRSTWAVISIFASVLLISGLLMYFYNFFKPSQQQVVITAQEFRNNKVDETLSNKEFKSGASFEKYDEKLQKLKVFFPKAEWNKTEIVMSDADYKAAQEDYDVEYKKYYNSYSYPRPTSPVRVTPIPYSMKGFMDEVVKGYAIDSIDFDKKIEIVDKMEFLVSLTNKINLDTLFHEDFKNLLKNSKNITLKEMESSYELHQKLTNTKIVYGVKEAPFERRHILFNFFDESANNELSDKRFETAKQLIDYAKETVKVSDTVVLANIAKKSFNLNLAYLKEAKTTGDAMEREALNKFMTENNTFNLKADELEDQLNSYLTLFTKKTEMAHVEFLARKLLREENKGKALNWVYYGLLFFSLAVLIVVTIRNNHNK